jgi:hypothetical protein
MSCPWWLAQKAKADWTGVLTHHSSNARHRSDPDSPVTDECRDDHCHSDQALYQHINSISVLHSLTLPRPGPQTSHASHQQTE